MSVTATQRFEIEKLLVLMFDAAPGAMYLSQVVGLYESVGRNLQVVANALDDLPVFQQLHPNFQTAAEFAADFLTPLGLQNDGLAKNFVMDKFNAGVPKGEIMYQGLQALNGLGSDAASQYLAAKAILNNKAAVSEYYSVTLGISNDDIGILQMVLNGITADPATVTMTEHEIDAGTRGVQGVTTALTTSQDTIIGTKAADLVNGLFGGSGATYTAGDRIDGGAGTDRIHLVATGTDASATVIVKNVESIEIHDTVGATFNALLVEDTPTIGFTNTLKGQTSTVTNVALASAIGLAGKGDLVVDYATTSGTTDTANVALNGVGASAADPSTVNVNDTDTVEAFKVATSGVNFVNLLAGAAAGTVTITGDGANTFTMGSIKTTSVIDASASTGANTFNLGSTLGNGDVVKGGTGADTVSINVATAFGTVTLTGVETLKADVDADVAINLGTSTGLKTLTLAGGSGSVDVTNATSELATVNYQSTATDDTDNDFSLTYRKGEVGNLTLNLGTTAANQPLQLDDVSVVRAQSLIANFMGPKDILLTAINLDAMTKSVELNAGASAYLEIATIDAPAAEGIALDVSIGPGGAGRLHGFSAGSFGNVILVAGEDASILANGLRPDAGAGDVSLTVQSGGDGGVNIVTAHGDVGDVDSRTASGGFAQVVAVTNGGNLGDAIVHAEADAQSRINVAAYGTGTTDDAYAGGNIGDITVEANGSHAGAFASVYASQDPLDGNRAGEEGNIGNLTMVVAGSGASGEINSRSIGGDQGDYAIQVAGSGGGYVSARAEVFDGNSGGHGNIGDISVNLEDDASLEGAWFANGDIGNTDINGGDDAHVVLELGATDIGSVDIALGERAWLANTLAASHTIGDVHVAAGEDSQVEMIAVCAEGGKLGMIEVTAASGSSVILVAGSSASTIGSITIAGGDAGDVASATVVAGSIASIDLQGWQGSYQINASGVAEGTTILAGAGGGTILAAGGADSITGGAGDDIIDGGAGLDLIDGGTGDDIITGGRGVDVMTGGAGADIFIGLLDFSEPSIAIGSAVVTDVITDFQAESDGLGIGPGGMPTNYLKNTSGVATMSALLADANEKLDGTVQFYFGVFDGNGYLVFSDDGSTTRVVLQLNGVTDLESGSIFSGD